MKLIRYLKPYWLFALLTPLTMVVEVAADLMQPRLLETIINEGVAASNMKVIWTIGAQMLLIAFIGGAAGISSAYFGSVSSQSFGCDLRNDTYKKVMSLSLEQTDKFTTGSLITRITNDITTVQNMVSMALRMFVRSPLTFIGGIIMALSISWKYAIVIAIALPVEIFGMVLVLRKANPLFKQTQKRLDDVNSVVQENVGGARVVKAFVREDHEIGRFDKANTALRDVNYKVLKLLSIIMPLMMIIMNATIIAVILVGGYQVQAAELKVGSIMAGVNYVTMILSSLLMVGMMFQQIARASASSSRICDVLYCEPVIKTPDSSVPSVSKEGKVEFRNVSFSYPGTSGRPVLSGIDLTVNPGEYLAILGATGSGKSSLVRLIPRFYEVTSGELLVDGKNVREYDLEELREKISFVLQKTELFAGTIADNIRWGKADATDEEVREAARIAQVEEFINEFNDGYDTMIEQKGTSLSGGQKQRVSIARALVRKPEIVIFDDSTSALDIGTETRLRKALRESLEDTTIIMIAQRIASVMQADRIAVLENGVITACGSHEELMKTSATYRDIYDSQLGNGGEVNE